MTQSFALPHEAALNAMVWVEGFLWVHDSQSQRILLYKVEAGALVLRASQPSIARLRLRSRIPFANF